jgi:hypothetical protein
MIIGIIPGASTSSPGTSSIVGGSFRYTDRIHTFCWSCDNFRSWQVILWGKGLQKKTGPWFRAIYLRIIKRRQDLATAVLFKKSQPRPFLVHTLNGAGFALLIHKYKTFGPSLPVNRGASSGEGRTSGVHEHPGQDQNPRH